MNLRAIVPAAGKGSRLSADGRNLPKVLHTVCGRTLIDLVLEQLTFIGRKNIYVVVGYGADKVTAAVGNSCRFVEQKEQLGTGHAVSVCADEFRDWDGTVLVTFGDMPLFRGDVMRGMCEHHEKTGAACTLMTARNPELTDWARIIRTPDGRFCRIVEGRDCTPEQAKTDELFAGVLVFDSKTLFAYLPRLDRNNAQHEYYLTEVPELLAADGHRVETFPTDDPDDLRGVNTPEDIAICEAVLKKREKKTPGK